jgi:hypothetical protein
MCKAFKHEYTDYKNKYLHLLPSFKHTIHNLYFIKLHQALWNIFKNRFFKLVVEDMKPHTVREIFILPIRVMKVAKAKNG